jgi:hypothetical protein
MAYPMRHGGGHHGAVIMGAVIMQRAPPRRDLGWKKNNFKV